MNYLFKNMKKLTTLQVSFAAGELLVQQRSMSREERLRVLPGVLPLHIQHRRISILR